MWNLIHRFLSFLLLPFYSWCRHCPFGFFGAFAATTPTILLLSSSLSFSSWSSLLNTADAYHPSVCLCFPLSSYSFNMFSTIVTQRSATIIFLIFCYLLPPLLGHRIRILIHPPGSVSVPKCEPPQYCVKTNSGHPSTARSTIVLGPRTLRKGDWTLNKYEILP